MLRLLWRVARFVRQKWNATVIWSNPNCTRIAVLDSTNVEDFIPLLGGIEYTIIDTTGRYLFITPSIFFSWAYLTIRYADPDAGYAVRILVNNAAINPKVVGGLGVQESSRLENFALDQWNLQIAVGLTGAFLCSQVFGTAMAQSGGGIILNIASDLSVFSPDQRLYRKSGLPDDQQPVKPVTYSVIKAGLVGLTKYLSTYWADRGVRANALSPGGVFNGQGDEFVQRLSALIPLGRMAQVDEYRSAVQFLCSDASSYLNGQNIIMDGGRSTW